MGKSRSISADPRKKEKKDKKEKKHKKDHRRDGDR